MDSIGKRLHNNHFVLLARFLIESLLLNFSSKQEAQKFKQFKWTSKMAGDLMACLKIENQGFQGLDFVGDRAAQYKELGK